MTQLLKWRNPDGEELNWLASDGSLKQGRPLVGRAIVTEIALACLAVTAVVESVAYSVLFLAAPCCSNVRNWAHKRLQSSAFTCLWALSDLLIYNLFYRNIYTHESFARCPTKLSQQEDGAYCDQVSKKTREEITSTFQKEGSSIGKATGETADLRKSLQCEMQRDLQLSEKLREKIRENDTLWFKVEEAKPGIEKNFFSRVSVSMQKEAQVCFEELLKQRAEWKQRAERCLEGFNEQRLFREGLESQCQELLDVQQVKELRQKWIHSPCVNEELKALLQQGEQLRKEVEASFQTQRARMEQEVRRQEAVISLKQVLQNFLGQQESSVLEMALMTKIVELEQRLNQKEELDSVLTRKELQRIEEGVDFLCNSILARTTQKFDDRFEESDIEMIEYVLAKSIWIYVGGVKRDKEVLGAFKEETRKAINNLRTFIRKGELDSVFVNMKAFIERPTTNISNSMKILQNAVLETKSRELQGGIFITKCWQRAINRQLVKKGANFLQEHIFNGASLSFQNRFKQLDVTIALYILVKAIWIYSCGTKRKDPIGLFRDETRMKIEKFREAFKENELKNFFIDIESFEKARLNLSVQETMELFCVVAVEEMQDGILVTSCWKKAVSDLTQIKKQ